MDRQTDKRQTDEREVCLCLPACIDTQYLHNASQSCEHKQTQEKQNTHEDFFLYRKLGHKDEIIRKGMEV